MTPRLNWASASTLLGGQPVPAHSFGLVLEERPAARCSIHDPEVELGIGVALLGGQPAPAHSFGLVLENAPPVGVHDPEVELGTGVDPARRPAGTSAQLRPRP